jgi:UDP-N-acetylmuramoyl-L-alanyl-D-glutamate--2,6-diaminopimelate ligase
VKWRTLIAELAARGFAADAPSRGPEVEGVCYDSRRAKAGDLFCALSGAKEDGMRFAADAVRRGAAAVLHAGRSPVPGGAAEIRVEDPRGAMAAAAAAAYGDPTRKLDVFGVTGTNGKTTVTFMLRRLLEAAGMPCALVGTVRYEWAGRVLPADRTTPEAPDLQRMFAEAVAAGQRAAAMEVSSQGLCARRLEGIRFAAGVFTNLTPEHLDYHGDMESYFAAKRQLFEALDGEAPAIVNADDPYGRRLAEDTSLAGRVVRFSMDSASGAEVYAENVRCGAGGSTFRLCTPWGTVEVRLPLIGRYNVANALAAAAAAGARGVAPGCMAEAFADMPGVPGRVERIPDPRGGRHLFVDYAHTPDALENLLRTLRELLEPPGRLVCVFGCGGNRDATKRPVMGRIAARLADATVLTSDNPRNEDPLAILREIRAGMAERPPVAVEPDRPAAIRSALREARSGDIVVVAGKGHETTQESANGCKVFMDDRRLLAEAAAEG